MRMVARRLTVGCAHAPPLVRALPPSLAIVLAARRVRRSARGARRTAAARAAAAAGAAGAGVAAAARGGFPLKDACTCGILSTVGDAIAQAFEAARAPADSRGRVRALLTHADARAHDWARALRMGASRRPRAETSEDP